MELEAKLGKRGVIPQRPRQPITRRAKDGTLRGRPISIPVEQCPDWFWGTAYKDENDCWIWNGEKSRRGYGRVQFYHKHFSATKMTVKLITGLYPELCVCHTCDNPTHLFLGTQKDNSDDCCQKGRRANRFNGNGNAKLKGSKYKEFLSRIAAGESIRSIYKNYGLTRSGCGEMIRYFRNSNPALKNRKSYPNAIVASKMIEEYLSLATKPHEPRTLYHHLTVIPTHH